VKLSNFIVDIGRVVAYYPNLKKITDSTTASILLCQFLYWSDKTKDEWIWKTSDDIEDETGLTYNEQRTARRILSTLGLITEEYKRLDHISRYKVNPDVLNNLWQEVTGKESNLTIKSNKKVKKDKPQVVDKSKATAPRRSKVVKKGDALDGMIAFAKTPGAIKENKIKIIRDKLEKKLHVVADNSRWKKFIDFVYVREAKHNESVEVFIQWALCEGFNPIFWTPEKLKTVYPQAFIKKGEAKVREDFVEPLPERIIEDYAPMPDGLSSARNPN